ncbi:MAG: DNA-processing protein DprA [Flavobacteriales bacterium]|nr:DNA-processing protein DprA [Flavobacteriales bacterium]
MTEQECQIALSFLEGVGPVYARKLVQSLGSAGSIFEESIDTLMRHTGVPEHVLRSFNRQEALERAESEVEKMSAHGITSLFFTHPHYPQRLEFCQDAPIVLYVKGQTNLNPRRSISIVGTRHATSYGISRVKLLLAELEPTGLHIVSGLAFGIDIAAHREAYKNGIFNVAVLAHGLDRVYPVQHRKDAQRILENGSWISEFPCGTEPDRENFPMRNRIVAGMSDLTVVVESAEKGGSLITANLAHAYQRELAAFPGRATDKFSAGCNELIRTQKAGLIQNARDLENFTGWSLKKGAAPVQATLFQEFNAVEQLIINALMKHKEMAIDDLCLETGLSMPQLSATLLQLEFRDLVLTMPGKRYRCV